MSLPLMKKPRIRQSLAVTIATLMMTVTHAASVEQEEIARLRAEVEVLKALIQQNLPQIQQAAVVSHRTKPQITTSKAVHSLSTEKASPLQVKASSGSEVKLYGFVRGDTSYQFDGGDAIFNRINAVALSDVANKNKIEDRFYSTATTTRLGLDFKAPIQDQDVGGKVEVDFRGSHDSLRIRHAYLTLNNWLFAQMTSTFIATGLQPEMLDFNAPLGIGTFRTPMVRYSDKFNTDTSYVLGLEKEHDDNRFSVFTAKLKHNCLEAKGTSSLGALSQEFRATDADNKTAFSWGLGLGTSYKLSEQLRVMGDYSHVKGDDKFFLYTNTAYNISPTTTYLNLNEFDALTVGTTYQFNPKVRSTLGDGLMLANDRNDFADGLVSIDTVQNKTLQQVWLNVMYSPVTPVTLGMEYVYGERETFSGKKGKIIA